jgi:DNA-binding XRE family transcriptional regulator
MMRKKKKVLPTTCKGLNLEAFETVAFADKEFRKEFEALRPEFELLEQFIQARKKARLSQVELAKRLKAQQPTIARLERGGYANASVASLTKYADALGYSIHISLRKKHV